MNETSFPLVSIGLAVYNGEPLLREALDSLLAQDYSNWEIIVSDNASTDGTWAICTEYAARDARIRVVRQNQNRGATWNFRFVAREARGKYFMWAAHDDKRAPTYLSRCVEQLEWNQDAVMCHCQIEFLHPDGSHHSFYHRPLEATSPNPRLRIRKILTNRYWTHGVYGLLRREVFQQFPLPGTYYFADIAWVFELALQGRLLQVHEPLYLYRLAAPSNMEEYLDRALNARDLPAWRRRLKHLTPLRLIFGFHLLQALARSPHSIGAKVLLLLDWLAFFVCHKETIAETLRLTKVIFPGAAHAKQWLRPLWHRWSRR